MNNKNGKSKNGIANLFRIHIIDDPLKWMMQTPSIYAPVRYYEPPQISLPDDSLDRIYFNDEKCKVKSINKHQNGSMDITVVKGESESVIHLPVSDQIKQ